MAVTSIAEFLALLQQVPLLDPTRLEQLIDHPNRFADLSGLTCALVSRGWLTALQVERLLQGTGASLIVGPYVLLERLGSAGMGEVYKARHERLGRLAALKVMRRDFQHDARAAANLQHVNIVAIRDVGLAGEVHYIAMELVCGVDLAQLVKLHGPLPEALACNLVRQAAIGLQHAHEQGLVHGDIKPSNLMVAQEKPEETPVVKILGFGLGLPVSAPEQADIRSDIFSLSCTLFYLLTGTPFSEGLATHVFPEIEATLAKMLARDSTDRYQTPVEVAAALEPFAQGVSWPAHLLADVQGPEHGEIASTVAAGEPYDDSRESAWRGHLLSWGIRLLIVAALCLAAYFLSRPRE